MGSPAIGQHVRHTGRYPVNSPGSVFHSVPEENVRILLLVTAFNGLSQRAWCALREAGHDVGVQVATSAQDMIAGVRAADPELIVCPFLKDRVPAQVWQNRRTIIIHPGPVGDRGPSSL